MWHCLKPDLRKLRKRYLYKIHQFLLAVLDDEDDYVDVSSLIFEITTYHQLNFIFAFLLVIVFPLLLYD